MTIVFQVAASINKTAKPITALSKERLWILSKKGASKVISVYGREVSTVCKTVENHKETLKAMPKISRSKELFLNIFNNMRSKIRK